MAIIEVIGARLQAFDKPGSLLVKDTRFTRCFWPRLARPTAIFASDSSGLEIIGPPTPRNVVFPPGTVFPEVFPDAHYPAEQAVFRTFPGRSSLVGLSQAEAEVYRASYDQAVKELGPEATRYTTRSDCHFLTHRELISKEEEKPRFDEYVAELGKAQVDDIVAERVDSDELRLELAFIKVDEPEGKKFKLESDSKGGVILVEDIVDVGLVSEAHG